MNAILNKNLIIAFMGTIILMLIESFIGYNVKFWVISIFFLLFIIILNQFDILRNTSRRKEC